VVTATEFIQAEIARRKTKAMFSRYVSSDVVDELMNNPDEVALGGKKQVVTIMFCDIRGFTAYSENKDPQDVIKRCNEYLTAMTNIIFRHGGTLDKYLGDGLMAFLGAPVYYEDHVQRAIKTAIEIQQEVENLNQIWAAQGAIPLKVAVGINTGPAVVGNVGSSDRMDYTLIGEDVNLASRVEALSKLFEVLIVISERTVEAMQNAEDKDMLYYLGAEQVKGFTNPIGCYSVKGLDLSFEKSTDKGFK
jgi:adenylate cyclase